MRILLTNDDGFRAPGIAAMYEALVDHSGVFSGPLPDPPDAISRAPRDVVFPVAPRSVQSATGHGITFHTPLMVDEESVELTAHGRMQGLSVDGRPADCVKLAIANLWPERFGEGARPDLVISGMNDGANCGINVVYSGTVAAAIEAAFLGVPAIAVSMRRASHRADYAAGAAWGRRTIERLLAANPLKPHDCISINLPATDGSGPDPRGPLPPIRVCPMNTHGLVDKYERRVSPGGDVYFWAAGHGLDFRGTDPGSDVDLLLKHCITVTPLTYDLTRHAVLPSLRTRLESSP